jgi:hypothetical protein
MKFGKSVLVMVAVSHISLPLLLVRPRGCESQEMPSTAMIEAQDEDIGLGQHPAASIQQQQVKPNIKIYVVAVFKNPCFFVP